MKGIKSNFKFNDEQQIDNSSIINFNDTKIKNTQSLDIKQINANFRKLLYNRQWQDVIDYIDAYGLDILSERAVFTNKDSLKQLINILVQTYGPNINLNWIDVSQIHDMSTLFSDQKDSCGSLIADPTLHNHLFNGDISEWDVSNVESMRVMFFNSNFNGDISKWDVSNVKNMGGMFCRAKFNNDISNWDVSNVNNMNNMFGRNKHFNGDISKWDVSHVKSMHNMFLQSYFDRDISNWDISNAEKTETMFDNCDIKARFKPKMLQEK